MTTNNSIDSTYPSSVANGGTGDSSFTAYMPICGGTTTTGTLQSVATGSSGYVLTYVSSSALPTWQSPSIVSGGAAAYARYTASGTPTVISSFNVTSVTNNSAGDCTITFTTAFADANYLCLVSAPAQAGGGTSWYPFTSDNSGAFAPTSPTTTTTRVTTAITSGLTNLPNTMAVFFGS